MVHPKIHVAPNQSVHVIVEGPDQNQRTLARTQLSVSIDAAPLDTSEGALASPRAQKNTRMNDVVRSIA